MCNIPGVENYICDTLPTDSDYLAGLLEIRVLQNFNPITMRTTKLINYNRINCNLFQTNLTTKLDGRVPTALRNLKKHEIDDSISLLSENIWDSITEQATLPTAAQNTENY